MWYPLTKIVESTKMAQGFFFAMVVSKKCCKVSAPFHCLQCSNTYSNDLAKFLSVYVNAVISTFILEAILAFALLHTRMYQFIISCKS